MHSKHKLLLDSYFLEKGAKPFIGETNKRHLTSMASVTMMFVGGDRASIADLLCAATLDQTKEAGDPEF